MTNNPQFEEIRATDGVNEKVLKKIDTMLKKGRRTFGSSGANFTEQAFKECWREKEISQHKIAAEIVDAERDFTKTIKQWLEDKPHAILVDSVYTPGEEKLNDENFEKHKGLVTKCFTGHVIIIGNEVIIVDSLPFKKKKRYSLNDDGKILESDKEFIFSDYSTMKEKFQQWINYLDYSAMSTAIVAFTGEDAYTERYKSWFESSYRLIEKNRFIEFLDQKYEVISPENKNLINPNIVAQVVVKSVKPFDKYENVFNTQALATFK